MNDQTDGYDTEDVVTLERRPPEPPDRRQPDRRPPEPPERRPPEQDRNRIWIRNATIIDVMQERDIFYVTVQYRSQDRDRDQDQGRDRDRDRDRGRNQDRDRRPGGMQTIRLVVGRNTRIVNQNGREVMPRRLQEGMTIDALISAAMTRSMPPQATAFQILIVGRQDNRAVTIGRIIQVDARNQFIITMDQRNVSNIIRFNIDRNTEILGPNGGRIGIQNLILGMRVRVEHATFMTASIPPQTTAFVIRVI